MTQADLNRAVARATGETVERIQRIGFLLSDPHMPVDDPEDEQFGPSVIDWDASASPSEGRRLAVH